MIHKAVPLRSGSLNYLKDFILESKVLENDTIELNMALFDELALDYRKTYDEPLKEPFIFLGVWIKISIH